MKFKKVLIAAIVFVQVTSSLCNINLLAAKTVNSKTVVASKKDVKTINKKRVLKVSNKKYDSYKITKKYKVDKVILNKVTIRKELVLNQDCAIGLYNSSKINKLNVAKNVSISSSSDKNNKSKINKVVITDDDVKFVNNANTKSIIIENDVKNAELVLKKGANSVKNEGQNSIIRIANSKLDSLISAGSDPSISLKETKISNFVVTSEKPVIKGSNITTTTTEIKSSNATITLKDNSNLGVLTSSGSNNTIKVADSKIKNVIVKGENTYLRLTSNTVNKINVQNENNTVYIDKPSKSDFEIADESSKIIVSGYELPAVKEGSIEVKKDGNNSTINVTATTVNLDKNSVSDESSSTSDSKNTTTKIDIILNVNKNNDVSKATMNEVSSTGEKKETITNFNEDGSSKTVITAKDDKGNTSVEVTQTNTEGNVVQTKITETSTSGKKVETVVNYNKDGSKDTTQTTTSANGSVVVEKTQTDSKGNIVSKDVTDNSSSNNWVSNQVTKKLGSGSISIEDIVYGDQLNVVISSDTNNTLNAIVLYKPQSAPNEAYSETVPTLPGYYSAKVTFDGNNEYLPYTATCDFRIQKKENPVNISIKEEDLLNGLFKGGSFSFDVTNNQSSNSVDVSTPTSSGIAKCEQSAEVVTIKPTANGKATVTIKVPGDNIYEDFEQTFEVEFYRTPGLYKDEELIVSYEELVSDYGLDLNHDYTEETVTEYQDPASGEIHNSLSSILTQFPEFAEADNIIISDSVDRLGENAIADCPTLTKVEIPTTVTEIASSALKDCTNLEDIICTSESLTDVKLDAFEGTPWLEEKQTTGNKLVSLGNVLVDASHVDEELSEEVLADFAVITDEARESISQNPVISELEYVEPTKEVHVHSFSDQWTVDKASTCTEEGIKSQHCATCDARRSVQSIEKMPHNFTAQSTTSTYHRSDATCEEPATFFYKCMTCDACNEEYFTSGEPLGHDFSIENTADEYLVSSATCENKAVYYYKCSRCSEHGDTTYESGEPLGHDWEDPTYNWSEDGSSCTATVVCQRDPEHVVHESARIESSTKIQPTCAEKGTTEYSALFNNQLFTTQTKDIQDIVELGHDWEEPTYSWSEDGKSCKATVVCTRDSEHEQTEDGTISDSIEIESTCTGEGTTKYTASFENAIFSIQTKCVHDILALGHDITSQVQTEEYLKSEATYFDPAVYYYKCSRCDEKGTDTYEYGTKLIDSIAPTGTISIDVNSWSALQSNVTFGIFYNTDQIVTITADDMQSGVKSIEYIVTQGAISEEDLEVQNWLEYTEPIIVSPNQSCVIYAKITDHQDNVTYISSNGIVLDDIPPTIEGIEDGAYYHHDKSFTIPSDGSTTLINGTIKTGTYTFSTAGDYTIVITDQAGNSTTYNITIDAPGLYNAEDVMTASWDQLVSDGTIHVTDGVVTTNYYRSHVSDNASNASSSKLVGSLIIPDSVTSIGTNAFNLCSSLTSVTIPNSVISIDINAFLDCSSLTSVIIPNSVTKIGERAFRGCSNLTSVTIPNSVTSINADTFRGCSSLTSVAIPNSVTSIGNYAFSDCSKLTSVIIPNSVISINYGAFNGCASLTSIAIPDSVTSIGTSAFRFCSNLTAVIPNTVIDIGTDAFYTVPYVYYNGIATGSPWGATKVDTVYPGLYDESGNLLYLCTDIKTNLGNIVPNYPNTRKVVIPYGVTSVDGYAFHNCSSLTSIIIPNSVTSIGNNAFNLCSSLTSITIPSSVTSISHHTFNGCSSLTSIAIPNSVTRIHSGAFKNCTSLTSVTIPNSVTGIHSGAFENCTSLTSVIFNTTSGWYAYVNNYEITPLNSSDLANPSTAAMYLRSTYTYYMWTRE